MFTAENLVSLVMFCWIGDGLGGIGITRVGWPGSLGGVGYCLLRVSCQWIGRLLLGLVNSSWLHFHWLATVGWGRFLAFCRIGSGLGGIGTRLGWRLRGVRSHSSCGVGCRFDLSG